MSEINPTLSRRTIPLLAVSAAISLKLPRGAFIENLAIINRTANAVTGGIKIGTTAGGTDVISSVAVSGNAVTFFTSFAKRNFTRIDNTDFKTGKQVLYIDAVTGWNSAVLDLYLMYVDLTALA